MTRLARVMARPTRREFVWGGLASYIALTTAACRARQTEASDAAAAAPTYAPQSMNAGQYEMVSAVCDRLLPADQDPGALALGVPVFIDRMFREPELAVLQKHALRMLPFLDRRARQLVPGSTFLQLTEKAKDEVIKQFQLGAEPEKRFFAILLGMTLEGAFGDPRYGGNKDGRGYRMLGVDPDQHDMPSMKGHH